MLDPSQSRFGEAERKLAETLVSMALAEDLGTQGDLTAQATIPAEAMGSGNFVARAPGTLAGMPVLAIVAERFQVELADALADGTRLEPGTILARAEGKVRSLLAMERTALNFLQHLSGVATLTARYVEAIRPHRAEILDTRKTLPGWRALEKYAVRCGGGRNHRLGLFDAILIKDNHLAWLAGESDPIREAVAAARRSAPPGMIVEIEVDTLTQFEHALACAPDIILLDNYEPCDMAIAVKRRDAVAPGVLLEASGGVSLSTVETIARTGVDLISVGALTHSAPALDIAFEEQEPERCADS